MGQELQKYLSEIGFKDFEVAKPASVLPSPSSQSGHSVIHNCFSAVHSLMYSTVNWFRRPWMPLIRPMDRILLWKHVHLILDSGLLFEDDVQFVNNMLPSTSSENQIVSKRSWNTAVMDAATSIPVWNNLWDMTALPVAGSVIFCIAWSWKKTQQNKQSLLQQKALLQIMRDMYLVFGKSMKLLQENELILRGFTLAKTGSTVSRLENSDLPCMIRKWDSSPGLRIAVLQALVEAINILTSATQQLIFYCPLFGQLDNSSHYMSFLDDKALGLPPLNEDPEIKLSHLKRLHHVFLLLQSEFLRRLALCFCPELWKWNSMKQVINVMQAVCKVTENSTRIHSNLLQEYRVFYSYGISEKMQENVSPLPIQKLDLHKSTDTHVAVRSASLHLHALLLNTRALEEKLEEQAEVENYEEIISHLSDIVKELDVCRSCCEDGILQIKRMLTPYEMITAPVEKVTDKCVSTDGEVKIIPVGYTDLDPQVEDEVFEAVITQDSGSATSHPCDDEAISDEQMQYEVAKQLSKKMMQELKSVLAVKAEKWKEREAKALLAKQGISDSVESPSDDAKQDESMSDQNVASSSISDVQCDYSISQDSVQTKQSIDSAHFSPDYKKSPQHRLLQECRAGSDCSFERTDSPLSNASSSSSRAVSSNRSPKHVYASETFRPLQNDLQFSVGLYLSSDVIAKFQARNTGGSDTFSGLGDKSSSEESLIEDEKSQKEEIN